MRVYLTGPMSGIADNNFPEFARNCKLLCDLGYDVVSPHEIEESLDYDECMRMDIREMMTCKAVVQMNGWEASRGARLETAIAIMVGMPCFTVEHAISVTLERSSDS